MVPGGFDAGCGGEFHRRCAFVAGFGEAGGAVCGDGDDVLSVGLAASEFVVGGDPGVDRVCGGNEHLQFYGWDQWDHGRVFAGGSGAAAAEECAGGVRGPGSDRRDDPVRAGVRVFQFPAEEQGEMLRGRCRFGGDCIHSAFPDRDAGCEDGRYHLADVLGCVRC